mgnify:CR=1 FL=1
MYIFYKNLWRKFYIPYLKKLQNKDYCLTLSEIGTLVEDGSVLEIPQSTHFFDAETKTSYLSLLKEPLRFVIVGAVEELRDKKELLKKENIQGVALIDKLCKYVHKYDTLICYDVDFRFLNKTHLIKIPTDSCDFLNYCKSDCDNIRKRIPSFPDVGKINEMNKNLGCEKTNEYLYNLLTDYVSQ